MVAPAQQDEIFERGRAAVFPVPDVMAFAPAGAAVAAGMSAMVVAGDECTPDRGRDRAGAATDVEYFALAVGDDSRDVRITAQAAQRCL